MVMNSIKNNNDSNDNDNDNNHDNDNDCYFEEFLAKIFSKRKFSYFLLIIFINIFSLFIKFSIGLYGYSGKKF